MGNISTVDARALYTTMLIEVYRERVTPTSFLRSFFKTIESPTKNVSIEVQRGTEKIAVDVQRGTEGNRNSFSKSTEKLFSPPYYREFFDATELDLYDRMFGQSEISGALFAAFIDSVADKLRLLQDKIERSYELQCAQVFETGVVTLVNGDNIDYKRKAGSLIDKSGTPWSGAVDPYADLRLACDFIRQVGKSQGGVVNLIFGADALSAFLGNAIVKARADIRNFTLDNITGPQKSAVGAALHGEVTVGSYNARIWTYPEFYDLSGSSTPYINPKKVIVLPEKPNFVLSFAAVPQLIDEENPTVKKGAYVIGDYKDPRKSTHEYDIKSAGLAIPVAVDQLATLTVLA